MSRIPVVVIASLLAAVGRHCRCGAGQVHPETTRWTPVFRFQGIRKLAGGPVSQTEDLLKVVVANPTMIDAYRAGIPGNGKPFPDGSKIAKIEWKPKKMAESPFAVNVPDTLQDVFLIEKDGAVPGHEGMGLRSV